MLTQTLPFFGVKISQFSLIPRMLKGCFNNNPPRVRYSYMWDVNLVLNFLSSLYPLEDLCLKDLTLKLTALVALTTAARAQTLSALDLQYASFLDKEKVFIFQIQDLIKTSRPGVSQPAVVLKKFSKPELCVVKTLIAYIKRTKTVRKTSKLFISFVTFHSVTTSTLARWLKTVLCSAGINIDYFKAHSFRGATASTAFNSGCSVKHIMSTANWSSAKTFFKFYHRNIVESDIDFASAVLS